MSAKSVESMQDEIGTEDIAAPRSYRVDGIRYDLVPKLRGTTTTGYTVSCEGNAVPGTDITVVQHHGASAATRWVVLIGGGGRRECDTVQQMAAAIAEVIHG